MKKNKQKNIPKFRFPEFGGEWGEKRLEDIFDEVTKKVGNKNIETYSITAGRGFVSQKEKFGKNISGDQNSKYILLQPNQFSYNKGNSKTFKYGCVYLNLEGKEIAVPNVFISFKLKKQDFNSIFFGQLFDSHYLDHGLRRIISSSARMDGLLNVNKKYFFKLKIKFPKQEEEQQRIAFFLGVVDQKIDGLKKKKELMEKYKKGVMQKIFNQEIRFRDENGKDFPEWEERRLGEITTIKTGRKDVNAGNPKGKYRFYTCAKNYTFSDEYSFEGESIMVAGNAEVGCCQYYNGKFEAYQRTYVLQDFKIDKTYLYKYLSHFFRQCALSLKQTSAMSFIKVGMLNDFNVPIPQISEQQKIGSFLSVLDEKIEKINQELIQAQKFKKGLLQGLFV